MSIPLLTTKLYLPKPRPNRVVRPRLIQQLNDGLHRKLTLISAPAGFGKTTLISGWVSQKDAGGRMQAEGKRQPFRVAWLSLDSGENDPARFLAYMVTALQTIAPHVGKAVLNALQSPQPPPAESLLTTLLNEITTIPHDFTLVLDDYHVIDAQPVHAALTFLLEHLPPQMHLIITTREDPQLPLPRLRARGQLTELRAAELRFTGEETAVFLNQIMGLHLTGDEITALETRTEGWIAGLQLAALSLQGRSDSTDFIKSFTGSHRFVLDYLVEEVLHQQPKQIQAFLLQTAVLNRMCSALCDAVLLDDQPSGQAMLSYLEQANLFIIPLDNERRWYRYHHLFADLLRQRLQQTSASNAQVSIPELHGRASAWFEENGLEIEAFHHAAAAHDLNRAVRLIQGGGMPLQFRGGAMPILTWLSTLSKVTLDSIPTLWVTYASAILMIGQIVGVEEKVQAAEAALAGIEEDEAIRDLIGRIASIRATVAVTQHQPEQIITQAHRALAYLLPQNLPVRSSINWTLGYAYSLQGDRVAAQSAYLEAKAICDAIGHQMIAMMTNIGLAYLQELDNQFAQASEMYRQILQDVGDPAPPPACEVYLGLARIHYELNQLDTALEQCEKGLLLAKQIENTDRLIAFRLFLARIKLAMGDAVGAEKLLTAVYHTTHPDSFSPSLPDVIAAQVRTLLYQNKVAAAAQLADTHQLPISQARVRLAQGDPAAAIALLDAHQQQAVAKGWADEQLKSLVLLAIAHDAQGETAVSHSHLAQALTLAEPHGVIRTFIDEGQPMKDLLKRMKAEGGRRKGYVQQLIAAASDTDPSSRSPQPLIDPLSERELEVLNLIADGLSNRQISERLFLALSTVKGHNRNIFDKLQVQRRTEAVARARELALL